MEILATLELEDSIVKNFTKLNQGVVISLVEDLVIFISGNRIGVFSNSTITSVDGDFSKIPLSKIHITSTTDEETLLEEFTDGTIN